MEDHILSKHAKADSDKLYKCDDCEFKSENKEDFGKHYKYKHGSKAKVNNNVIEADETLQLKSELRQLKTTLKGWRICTTKFLRRLTKLSQSMKPN